jgi:hypothetical protein
MIKKAKKTFSKSTEYLIFRTLNLSIKTPSIVSPRAHYVHQAVTDIFLETIYKLTVVYMHMTK